MIVHVVNYGVLALLAAGIIGVCWGVFLDDE